MCLSTTEQRGWVEGEKMGARGNFICMPASTSVNSQVFLTFYMTFHEDYYSVLFERFREFQICHVRGPPCLSFIFGATARREFLSPIPQVSQPLGMPVPGIRGLRTYCTWCQMACCTGPAIHSTGELAPPSPVQATWNWSSWAPADGAGL